MASDPMLLGVDVEAPSQKISKVKIIGCIFCGVLVTMMLLNSNASVAPAASGASETDALAIVSSPLSTVRSIGSVLPRTNLLRGEAMPGRAVQDQLKAFGIGSSPLEQLAITAIDASARRDVSVKASEVVSGWSLVDTKTKDKLKRVLEEVKYKESALAGITAPMNFFDPLGFSTTVTAGKLLFYREVEIKHGRVAMLAALGILVGEVFHPLFGGDIDSPAAFAFQETPLQQFWPAVVAAIAIPEIYSVFTFQNPFEKGSEQWAIREDHQPGDLGFDPLGLKPKDPKAFRDMQTKELNNGRLAMIAAAGMIAQELATGQKLF